jgi:hypothetical protein
MPHILPQGRQNYVGSVHHPASEDHNRRIIGEDGRDGHRPPYLKTMVAHTDSDGIAFLS